MSKKLVVVQGLLIAALFLTLLLLGPASAEENHHPARDAAIHDQFYQTWDRPDFPGNNCCKSNDCYPAPFKRVGQNWYALSRTVEKDPDTGMYTNNYTLNDPDDPSSWVRIPPERLEQNQVPGRKARSAVDDKDYVMRDPVDSPDGRNHVCMIETSQDGPVMTADGRWFLLCAVLGEGM